MLGPRRPTNDADGPMGTDRRELAAIFVGGAIGGGARTGLTALAGTPAGHWPWATFGVNLVGCFLLGYFVTRLQERLPITAYGRPLLGTGICGGLTTFSTFQLEVLRMLDNHQVALAILYVVVSAAAGFVGVALGTAIVRRGRLTW
jgi:CrcB protein